MFEEVKLPPELPSISEDKSYSSSGIKNKMELSADEVLI
jgi:hypothetical protein